MEETIKKQRNIVPLEDMNVIDDFLFNEMLYDDKTGKEVCRIILESVLKHRVGKIQYTAQKAIPGISQTGQGIRLDAYISEEKNGNKERPDINIYDLEPDKRANKKQSLPKRSRYYSDLIDVQIVNSGVEYEKLPEVVIIFILSYDPFDQGDMYYKAQTMLETHPDYPYDDGIRRIYLYTDGKLPENPDNDDKKLKNLLQYIRRSTEENVTDETTKRLDEIVKATKRKKDVGIKYMKSWELERELREEGREEERANTEAERRRADEAESRVSEEKHRADIAEAELAKYRKKYGNI